MLTSCVFLFPFPELSRQSVLYSGTWKSAQFKKYNFEAEGIYPNGGALHPLLKVREEMRNIFLEMGSVTSGSPTCSLTIGHSQLCRDANILFRRVRFLVF